MSCRARDQARLEAELAELGADAEAVAAQSEDLMQERDALAAALAAAQGAAPGAPAQDGPGAPAAPAADAAAASPEADAADDAAPGAVSLDEVLARAAALVRRSEAAEAAAAAELRGVLAAAEQRAAALQDERAAAQVRSRRPGLGARRVRRCAWALRTDACNCAGRSSGLLRLLQCLPSARLRELSPPASARGRRCTQTGDALLLAPGGALALGQHRLPGSCRLACPRPAPPRVKLRRAAQEAVASAAAAPEPAPEAGDDLEARVAALTAEAEALAEEGLAKDEEIEALEGRLAHAAKARVG